MPTPTEAIAAAERVIDQNTPPGWTKRFVEPPWRGAKPACRGCGKDPAVAAVATPTLKWATTAIVKQDKDQKIVWYTFALTCENCARNKKTLNKITLEAFAPLESPIIGPSGLTPPPRPKS